MNYKYIVRITKDDNVEETKYKTRGEIATQYNIPLYTIDKIIKMTNDKSFKTKRKCHECLKNTFEKMKIFFIEPEL